MRPAVAAIREPPSTSIARALCNAAPCRARGAEGARGPRPHHHVDRSMRRRHTAARYYAATA
eukprot:4785102-Pleurochrysis_carterae.AAC.3